MWPRLLLDRSVGQNRRITVGPLLVAQGECGTPEELAAFAEWTTRADETRQRQIGWYFAESKKLETRRVGDHRVFRLTGLIPTLRTFLVQERQRTALHLPAIQVPMTWCSETPLKESRTDRSSPTSRTSSRSSDR